MEHAVALRLHEGELGNTSYVLDDDEFNRQYARYLVLCWKDDETFFYVAEDDGKIVATMIGELQMQDPWLRAETYGHIKFLYIDEDYRQQDIGTQLVKTFEKDMDVKGIDTITAYCFTANVSPILGLLSLGYRADYIHLTRELS